MEREALLNLLSLCIRHLQLPLTRHSPSGALCHLVPLSPCLPQIFSADFPQLCFGSFLLSFPTWVPVERLPDHTKWVSRSVQIHLISLCKHQFFSRHPLVWALREFSYSRYRLSWTTNDLVWIDFYYLLRKRKSRYLYESLWLTGQAALETCIKFEVLSLVLVNPS